MEIRIEDLEYTVPDATEKQLNYLSGLLGSSPFKTYNHLNNDWFDLMPKMINKVTASMLIGFILEGETIRWTLNGKKATKKAVKNFYFFVK